MAQNNAFLDVGTLLHLPAKTLSEFSEKMCLCISSIIREAKLNNQSDVQINIGTGILSIQLSDMQCKFIPDKILKTAIKRGLSADIDPLEMALDQALSEKLIEACQEVL